MGDFRASNEKRYGGHINLKRKIPHEVKKNKVQCSMPFALGLHFLRGKNFEFAYNLQLDGVPFHFFRCSLAS